MVLAWVDRICNFMDQDVILYHKDPIYEPRIDGKQYPAGRPIIIEPGFNDAVDNFIIPWRGFGELVIDIELPMRVVVGPHGWKGMQDWLQVYDCHNHHAMQHWQELGSRSLWCAANIYRHIHFTLVFSKERGKNVVFGNDADFVRFVRIGSQDVKTLSWSETLFGASLSQAIMPSSEEEHFTIYTPRQPCNEDANDKSAEKEQGKANNNWHCRAENLMLPVMY
eukprot:gnl/MRDRNA2_/MRDRNA2_88935_c0_seq1.p1 gnl/MRDRNA2_/MRDRNA2_88935_c0~~gnl/MRDRNA2_/MRDRNA2_88935_c0_seq1.p1  ORF type:complete len:254 (-),score=27.90 gnl/MRDRNA2_/MRDRNA2_88935_c0_seq1:66-734(-)